jgi:hypothetical protein
MHAKWRVVVCNVTLSLSSNERIGYLYIYAARQDEKGKAIFDMLSLATT